MEIVHIEYLNISQHQSNCSYPSGHAYEKRVTESYEFDYILAANNGKIFTEGKTVLLSPGMFFMRMPGMHVQGYTHYTSWYLRFKTAVPVSFSRHFCNIPPELCNPVFQKLYDLHIQQPQDYEYLVDYYMNSLFFILYEEEKRLQNLQKKEHPLAMVYQEIENSWKKNYPLDYYVRLSGYSKSRFCHLFQELYHIAPMRLLHYFRIQNLCYQLIETESRIKELMIEHGYLNEQSFFRTFKAYTGETPAAYRRNHRLE